MIIKRILFLFAILFWALLAYAQEEEDPALARKKTILGAIANVQQQQMIPRTNFLKNFFPKLLQNASLVSKYNDLDSFKQAEGTRAGEVLAQTTSDMARVETWLTQINAHYQKEYEGDIAAREKLLYAMNRNFRTERPDYASILPGRQIIFLWEEGGHAVPEIMDSALEVIKEVQKANPGKRILFSPEQLLWFDIEPFDNSPLLMGKTDYSAPAVRFTGEPMHPNMKSALRYDNLWEQVSDLGIDIMAMDDVLIDESWLYSFFKVGNISIPYLGGDEETHYDAYNRFRSTFYGVFQRNTQWDHYIRAVAPYYDVIIIFAGGAHYGIRRLLNMPADKVLNVFIRKLVVTDDVKEWDKKTHQAQGTHNDERVENQRKSDEEAAKTLSSTIYNQLQENGQTSAIYIVIP